MTTKNLFLSLAVALLLSACGSMSMPADKIASNAAPEKINAQVGDLVIGDAWARPTSTTATNSEHGHDANVTGMNSAAYMIIQNKGGSADRLMSISGDVAGSVELHRTTMNDGVMRMDQITDGAEVPAGGSLVLKPASYHVMLIGVKQNLLPGGIFKLTLKFKSGAEAIIDVTVREP
jgi:periplasmic copper chaperone A